MKHIRLIIIALILAPLAMCAQSKTSSTKSRSAQSEAAKYPLYNDSEAANLWGMWKRNANFTQENYGRIVDICIVSYDYLTTELQNIKTNYPSQSVRLQKALDLDKGIPSNMANFARTFAVRMQNLAAGGSLSPEVVQKVVVMLKKKKDYMQINHEIYHPSN